MAETTTADRQIAPTLSLNGRAGRVPAAVAAVRAKLAGLRLAVQRMNRLIEAARLDYPDQ